MIAFSVFAQVLLPIVVVVASGYVLQRRLELDLHSVNRVSLYLLSPALIFSSLVQLLRMPQIYAVLAAASPLDRQGYFSPGAHADYAAVMIGERTRKLIGIAHPKFRDELERQAREMDYL